jgi:hypothetical protein
MEKRPSQLAYAQLQQAYDFFNRELFEGKLPHVMIVQLRRPGSCGYWAKDRWVADGKDGVKLRAGELGMNPEHIKRDPISDVLSAVVHEQCHVWQTYFGTAPKGGYHNAEWGAQMELVGLIPSNTGKPGGKKTGPHMSDYIIEGGPFEAALAKLLATGFALTWGCEDATAQALGIMTALRWLAGLMVPARGPVVIIDTIAKPTTAGKRAKYCCPSCSVKARNSALI